MDFTINNDKYVINMTLFNDSGILTIPSNHFSELSLRYDIINWSVIGMFTYSDPFDSSERLTLKDEPYSEAFYFKNDGSDRLGIEIILKNSNPSISAIFYISDVVGSGSDISENSKIIHFTDTLTHELSRTNIDISSAVVNNDFTSLSNLNNTDRTANVADMLVATADYTNADVTFDTVEQSGNKIFHTTLAQDTGLETFNCMLGRYVGVDNTFGVLRFDHSTGNYNLSAIGTLMSSYKDTIVEQFTLSDNLRISDNAFNAYKSNRKSVNLGLYSNIETYEYSKTSPLQNITTNVNTSIATYDTLNKSFTILNKDLSIKNIKTEFIDKIATPIQNNKSNTQAYPMLSIDTLRLEGQNTKQLYILNQCNVYKYIADSLKSTILLNDAISFPVLGNMERSVGDIIEIVSPNMENGRWSNRMYGYWLILNITHDFTTEQYTNNIYAVKLSTNQNMEFENDV